MTKYRTVKLKLCYELIKSYCPVLLGYVTSGGCHMTPGGCHMTPGRCHMTPGRCHMTTQFKRQFENLNNFA